MKKKLKLEDLKIQSFVTAINKDAVNAIGGAAETVAGIVCANTLNQGTTCVSDAVRSLCQTCGIVCNTEQ